MIQICPNLMTTKNPKTSSRRYCCSNAANAESLTTKLTPVAGPAASAGIVFISLF